MSAPTKRLSSLLRGVTIASLWLVIGMAHAGTKHYYYTDPQGTVLAKADEQGTIISRNDYAPYGSASPNMDAAPDGPGYTGHVNDPDTGLVYMQARYYDPVVGRFLSEDPVGPAVGNPYNFNQFAYANNNPIVNMDADGRTAILDSQNVIDGPGYSISVNPNSGGIAQKQSATASSEATHSDGERKQEQTSKNELSYSTFQPPLRGEHGSYDTSIIWHLKNPSTLGGYVVQHMVILGSANLTIVDPIYSEAWKVNPGQTATERMSSGNYNWDDEFVFPGSSGHGSIQISASARFYEGLKLPKSFKPYSIIHAGPLPATAGDPALPENAATAPVNRNLSTSW